MGSFTVRRKEFWEDVKAQKLPGKYPFPSSRTVFPVTFSTAFICIVIAILIQLSNFQVKEVEIPYANLPCNCSNDVIDIQFRLTENWQGPITLFYRIQGFPMNHRKFQQSKCRKQLEGEIGHKDFKSECLAWWGFLNVSTIEWADMINETGIYRAPIGSWANAMFNDTFELSMIENNRKIIVPLTSNNVLTRVEKEYYAYGNCSSPMFTNTSKPRYWKQRMCEFEGGYQNVDFVVWMRGEANMAFKKMYRYISLKEEFKGGLPAGMYSMSIENNWARCNPNISKSFILFQPSWYGHKDRIFFYICYAVGIFYLVVGTIMYMRHIERGKTFEEVCEMTDDDE